MECQIANRSIFYKIIGAGKLLVTISGIPSDHHIIESWLEPIFATRPGWQRIYFDLPGTGQTSGEGITTIDQVLDIVCEFIDAILPGQRFTLLGLSAGGYLARGVVEHKRDQVDGLCLLVPWLSEHDQQQVPASVPFFKDSNALAQLTPEDAELLAGLAVVQNQKVVDWYREVVIKARQSRNRSQIEQRTYAGEFEAALHPFEKPTLILTGRQDAHVGYRDGWNILEQYPRATFAVLDRAGHALGVEQAGLLEALIQDWLDRVDQAKNL